MTRTQTAPVTLPRPAGEHHRDLVGGLWEEIGCLQSSFLRDQGLTPSMRLLDIGCGCLRGGVHFVRYLDPGNYFGIDRDQSLLDAGYELELPRAGLDGHLPRANLLCNEMFDFSAFATTFQMALAQSVFTHLPLNEIRLCLVRAADVIETGGRLFATYFECPSADAWRDAYQHISGVWTYPARDPYHYMLSDLDFAARELPFKVSPIGEWNHPRNQKVISFERI